MLILAVMNGARVRGVDVCPPSVFSLEEIISSSKCDDVCWDDFVNVQVCRTAVGFPTVRDRSLVLHVTNSLTPTHFIVLCFEVLMSEPLRMV